LRRTRTVAQLAAPSFGSAGLNIWSGLLVRRLTAAHGAVQVLGHHPVMALGRVVLLNGATSSGKTAIARAFQRLSHDPWLRVGIDAFWGAIDERWMEFGPRAAEGFRWVEAGNGDPSRPEMRIVSGPVGDRLAAGMRAAVGALAREGNDVIVDDVLIEPAWLDGWSEILAGIDTLFVGVRCDLETIERRELERGDRVLGEARGQIDVVHRDLLYDVEVDTSSASPEECASVIAQARTSASRPRALERGPRVAASG
jgi:chloramphenicol 3-O phosphotransferase